MRLECLVIVPAVLTLSGCASTVWVSATHGDAGDQVQPRMGLPFQAKRTIDVEVHECLQIWFDARLEVFRALPAAKDGTQRWEAVASLARRAPISAFSGLTSLAGDVAAQPLRDARGLAEVVSRFQAIENLQAQDVASSPMLHVGWAMEQRTRVDTGTVYYLNAPLPWFGQSTLSPEFADGALSKLTVTVDTKLADGLSALVPLREFATGEKIADPAAAAASPDASLLYDSLGDKSPLAEKTQKADPSAAFKLAMSLKEAGWRIRVEPDGSKACRGNNGQGSTTNVCTPACLAAAPHTRTAWAEPGDPATSAPKQPAASQIGLSGTITLPKPESPGK